MSPPQGPGMMGEPKWPTEATDKYDRIEVLGKGSFGMVWMSKRVIKATDEFDDEYVAIKNINIKDEKGEVYAEREIGILKELRHPHVIRLINSYNMVDNESGERVYPHTRLVVMQLARGPNLHQLVIKRGALGLPLSRQVSRELIAAVSYLHGRGVIHRDIKPSNCILACEHVSPTQDYDWIMDDAIWSSGKNAEQAVAAKKWKLMLVDFGFARALEKEEIVQQAKKMRNSILFEQSGMQPRLSFASKKMLGGVAEAAAVVAAADSGEKENGDDAGENKENDANENDDDDLDSIDMAKIEEMAGMAASKMKSEYEAHNELEDAIMGQGQEKRKRPSYVSVQFEEEPKLQQDRRKSHARHKVRSMSALGTKAYAAPEIRKQLRHKNSEDFSKANAAMTECVADYGMIVDAYSVGWTLRVAMTGVPPNFSLSEYMQQRENVVLIHGDETKGGNTEEVDFCCCMGSEPKALIKIRDPGDIPYDATLLIAQMTEKKPEDRMSVREAQLQPWIAGNEDEEHYLLPEGDVPSRHGDPVVPLECAPELSKLTVQYHMQ
eukprot:CAMPEP_0172475892 /NCGR_PEP_ID=MMETSP1065-20121228/70101_1 /TAXON_ID=265537 /ORGANISM="Amphiprora paludosa, Strain CCMP125" /LENGTH=550 /DNA_ID=CAMNT_0013234107 /DNA_START=138 /DNA_END=1790 /DNA_ORIENTATION=+